MVSQALVTRKAQFGYGKAASKVGVPCGHYRPTGAGDPLATGWPLPPLNALFYSKADLSFTSPSRYGTLQWVGVFSTADTLVGDYIIDPNQGTFFICNQETFLPASVVPCNRVLTFTRPGMGPTGPGYYGGDQTATETPLLTRWPASVTAGTKGNAGPVGLPGDIRDPWVLILVPSVGGVQLRSGDIAVDEQGILQRYILSSCELTSFGYRLTAELQVT